MGYSLFFHRLLNRVFPSYWQQGSWTSKRVHKEGIQITCKIFEQMGEYVSSRPFIKKLILLVQYPEKFSKSALSKIDKVVPCLTGEKIRVLDLRNALLLLNKENPNEYASLFKKHMAPKGNHFVARKLEEYIRKPGISGKQFVPYFLLDRML
jgi:hypothetical protein